MQVKRTSGTQFTPTESTQPETQQQQKICRGIGETSDSFEYAPRHSKPEATKTDDTLGDLQKAAAISSVFPYVGPIIAAAISTVAAVISQVVQPNESGSPEKLKNVAPQLKRLLNPSDRA
jgi:hypothetical protein